MIDFFLMACLRCGRGPSLPATWLPCALTFLNPRTSLRDDAGRLHGDSATLIAVSVTDVAKSAAQRPEAILANLTC